MIADIEKVADLQAQFQDKEEEIQATGELNFETFKFDKEDIQGEFRFDFDVDSLRAINEAQVNNINNLLQILASQEILHPVLKTLSPEKLARILFKGVNLNLEALQNMDIENAVFVNPEKENEMARRGDPMPNPKKDENHEDHNKIHGDFLIKNGENEQILEHMAGHLVLQQRAEGGGVQAPTEQVQNKTREEVLEPRGPGRPPLALA